MLEHAHNQERRHVLGSDRRQRRLRAARRPGRRGQAAAAEPRASLQQPADWAEHLCRWLKWVLVIQKCRAFACLSTFTLVAALDA